MRRRNQGRLVAGLCGVLLTLHLPDAGAQSAATATSGGVYLGGGAIYTRIDNQFVSEDFPSSDDEFDDSRVSWKAFAGLRFTPALALEAQYLDFGKSDGAIAEAEADGWTAALVAAVPLGAIEPYAKAGALFWDADARAEGPLHTTLRYGEDGTEFFWGLGINVHFSSQLALRLEYERFRLDGDQVETDIDAATAGLRFSF